MTFKNKTFWTAMITPFASDNSVDFYTFTNLCHRQVAQGVDGLVVAGTTGESLSLTPQEYAQLIDTAVSCTNGAATILAGVAAADLNHALRLAHIAVAAGAHGLLVTSPYYIRTTQEELFKYYQQLHDAVNLPLYLYDNPRRGSMPIANETVVKLAALPRIIGLKDAAGDITRASVLRLALAHRPDFSLLCGDDLGWPGYLAQGGDGCISVVGNLAPKWCSELQQAWEKQDMDQFKQRRDSILRLVACLNSAPNPSGIKYAVSLLNHCPNHLRAPVAAIADDSAAADKITEAIKFYNQNNYEQ